MICRTWSQRLPTTVTAPAGNMTALFCISVHFFLYVYIKNVRQKKAFFLKLQSFKYVPGTRFTKDYSCISEANIFIQSLFYIQRGFSVTRPNCTHNLSGQTLFYCSVEMIPSSRLGSSCFVFSCVFWPQQLNITLSSPMETASQPAKEIQALYSF